MTSVPKKRSNWRRPLARSLGYTKPKRGEMRTLDDARAFLLHLGPKAERPEWQRAIKLVLAAAEGGDIEAATYQIEYWLFVEGALVPR